MAQIPQGRLATVTRALRVRWNNGLVCEAGYVQVAGREGGKNRQALARLSKMLPIFALRFYHRLTKLLSNRRAL
jgi:hypothetical protein